MPPVHGYQQNKTLGRAYLWYWTLGWVGGHHYYLGNTPRGVAYSFSFGGLFMLWFIDMFRMDRLVRESNQDINLKNTAANTALIAQQQRQQPPL